MGYKDKLKKVVIVYFGVMIVMGAAYAGNWLRGQKTTSDKLLVATTHVALSQYRSLGIEYDLLLIAAAVLLPGIYFYVLPIGRAVTVVVLSGVMIGVAWVGAYTYFEGLYIPVVYILSGLGGGSVVAMVFKMVFASHEQEFLRVAFSQFVSAEVLKELLKDPNKLALQGRELPITVLFLDIRGFTAFAASHNPVLVVNRLNHLLDIATQIIFKNGGTLDKYIGDAVMAFWGAPTANKRQAQNALKAAIEIREKILRETEFEVGVGINTGTAIVGNIGSTRRFDYTAIGDTVNTAARLETATKDLGENIVMSAATVEKLRDEKVDIKMLKDRGEIVVKGKSEAIHVFAI